jgi:hypothetical protein
MCGGEGVVECTKCKKRLTSKKNKAMIETLRKLFKRDEKIEVKEGEEGAAPVEAKPVEDRQPEAKPEGKTTSEKLPL